MQNSLILCNSDPPEQVSWIKLISKVAQSIQRAWTNDSMQTKRPADRKDEMFE